MEYHQAILRPDSRGRITLGILADGVSGYKVSRGKYGKITLEPQVEIPAHEAGLYKNKKALAAVQEGIRQATKSKGKYLGSFAKFANDEID